MVSMPKDLILALGWRDTKDAYFECYKSVSVRVSDQSHGRIVAEAQFVDDRITGNDGDSSGGNG
jgi:hypothetical protein